MIREKLGKRWIKVNGDVKEETSENVETKEEKEMGFFAKHKKGLIIGGLGALAAGAVGLVLANKSSDDDFEDDYDEDFDGDTVEDDSDEESTEA